MTEQLALDFVGTADLSDAERAAIVGDFLACYSDTEMTNGALVANRCRCPHPLPLVDETGERCLWCGREPRR